MGKHQEFISEIDRFLMAFDDKHPIKSPSQQAEIDKHKLIAEARTKPIKTGPKNTKIDWESF